MNEVQAAFGLLQLKYIDHAIQRRKAIDRRYRDALKDISGITCMAEAENVVQNYSYFPILIDHDYPLTREGLYHKLQKEGIYVRRYFYPLISDMPMYKVLDSTYNKKLPVAKEVSEHVLCLPIFPDFEKLDQQRVINVISGDG